jgi:hypothetical protein
MVTGGMAPEHLPSKSEALSSNPRTAKEIKTLRMVFQKGVLSSVIEPLQYLLDGQVTRRARGWGK